MRRTSSESSTHYRSEAFIQSVERGWRPDGKPSLSLARPLFGECQGPFYCPPRQQRGVNIKRSNTDVEQSFQSISFYHPDFRAQDHKQPSWKDTPSKKTDTGPESIVFFHPPTYHPLSPLVAKFMHWIWQRKGEIRCSHHHLRIQLRPHAQNDIQDRPRLRESATAVLRNLCVN